MQSVAVSYEICSTFPASIFTFLLYGLLWVSMLKLPFSYAAAVPNLAMVEGVDNEKVNT